MHDQKLIPRPRSLRLRAARSCSLAVGLVSMACVSAAEPRDVDGSAWYGGGSAALAVIAGAGGSLSTNVPLSTGGAPPVLKFDALPSAGVAGAAACSAESRESRRIPLDLYLLVDSSLSMNERIQSGTRWAAVSEALVAFLRDPRNSDTNVAVGYFPFVPPSTCVAGDPLCFCLGPLCFSLSPSLGSCEAADYAQPAVPLASTPNISAVIANILSHERNGGTPTRAALEGALGYLATWSSAHPDRKPVVVLATDGEPTGCVGNTPQDVATVAAAGLALPIPIQTFVIGVGRSLQSLDLIARAGGTEKAFLVEDSQASTALGEALSRIRALAESCDFAIPSDNDMVAPDKVNVKYTPAGTSQPTIVSKTFDGTSAGCGPDGGWYYDEPAAPSIISLCPATCNALSGGSIQVEFGCQTIVQVPR